MEQWDFKSQWLYRLGYLERENQINGPWKYSIYLATFQQHFRVINTLCALKPFYTFGKQYCLPKGSNGLKQIDDDITNIVITN